MSYAQTAHDHGLATTSKTKSSFITQVLCWLGQKITVNKRIFLNALVPLMGFLSLWVAIFCYSFGQYSSVQQLLGLTGVIPNINTLSHHLQIERGLSQGHRDIRFTHHFSHDEIGNMINAYELMRVKRYKHGLSLMMIDIDHFKKVNDTYGYAKGYRVL